ncbi:MAG: aspartate carbamoyltransferase catalytic subunit [Wenzhouxiangella sp.]|nr:MAG: aspartate carbamoyltransferase catalytic subunit [Wenzhouxiangella sp.]
MTERPGRHLLDIEALEDDTIRHLLNRAGALAAGADTNPIDMTVANLFFEPSTRTRVSFELAALRLGMRVINIELDRSSSTKGESLADTATTLSAMGVNCIVLRHPETGRCHALAAEAGNSLSLLNAGDGSGHHPSQALLDAATIEAQGLAWPDLDLSIVGDIRHSRVARSGLALFRRLGVGRLRIAGPAELLPEGLDLSGIEVCETLDQAIRGANVVMMLRIQRERMDQAGWPDSTRYHREWGLGDRALALAAPDCRVMHPGPINRGVEIAGSIADGSRSLILEQVRMGVYMRMAILEWLAEAQPVP